MKEFRINPEEIKNKLTEFIRDEAQKACFSRGIVGISGGVDSATVAILAALALGPENVWGILMPYKTSSENSVKHARIIVKMLGINSQKINITTTLDKYFRQFPDVSNIRKGNKMARERMSILYDLSAKHQALVIGASNKSELLLGYGTIYGDTACAIMPLGDLYKTQVYALAKHLGVPEPIIQKPPSADLWPGQTDEEEMDVHYELADRLFYSMVDCLQPTQELVKSGFKRDFIDRIKAMIEKSGFKRRLPLIPK
jgi:NAD+ synthase